MALKFQDVAEEVGIVPISTPPTPMPERRPALKFQDVAEEVGIVNPPPQRMTGKILAGTDPFQEDHPVIQSAKKYEGTPYVFGSTDRKRGLDCSSFVQAAFDDIGVSLPRTAREQYKTTERVGKPQPGDLVCS